MNELIKPVNLTTRATETDVKTSDQAKLIGAKVIPIIVFLIPGSTIAFIAVGYGMSRFTKRLNDRETVINKLRHCITPVSKTLPIYFNKGLLSFFKKIPLDWNLNLPHNSSNNSSNKSPKYKITPTQLALLLNWADQTKLIKDGSSQIKSVEEIILMIMNDELVNTLKISNYQLYQEIFKEYDLEKETDQSIKFYISLRDIVDKYIIYLSKFYQESKPAEMMKMHALRYESLIKMNEQLASTKHAEIQHLKTLIRDRKNPDYAKNKNRLDLLNNQLANIEKVIRELRLELLPLTKSRHLDVTKSGKFKNFLISVKKFFSFRSKRNVYAIVKNDNEYKKQRYIIAEQFLDKLEALSDKIDLINSSTEYDEINFHIDGLQKYLDDLRSIANTTDISSDFQTESKAYYEYLKTLLKTKYDIMTCKRQ
jgi:hypothetical protein